MPKAACLLVLALAAESGISTGSDRAFARLLLEAFARQPHRKLTELAGPTPASCTRTVMSNIRSPKRARSGAEPPLCSDAEVLLIDAALGSLLSRDVLPALSPSCRVCFMSTVNSVCGNDCAQRRFHVVADVVDEEGRSAPLRLAGTRCLPDVADRLMSADASQLAQAIEQREPFGICSSAMPATPSPSTSAAGHINDLFVPTDAYVHGLPVFRGLSGQHMFACSRAATGIWAFSPSSDPVDWVGCDVSPQLDLRMAQARPREQEDRFVRAEYLRLGDCASTLQAAVSAGELMGPVQGFPAGLSAVAVACWLATWFGPQNAADSAALPGVVELPAGLGRIELLADLIVRGKTLQIIGNGNTLVMGTHQLRVEALASLTLEFLTIAESRGASALLIEQAGSATLQHCTVRDSLAQANALSMMSDDIATASVHSRGGGIYVRPGGSLELLSTRMHGNRAADADRTSGGAVFAMSSAVRIADSQLHDNLSERAGLVSDVRIEKKGFDGWGIADGGAVSLQVGASLLLVRSNLSNNAATDGAFWSQGKSAGLHSPSA